MDRVIFWLVVLAVMKSHWSVLGHKTTSSSSSCPIDDFEVERLFQELQGTEQERRKTESRLNELGGRVIPPKAIVADLSHLRGTKKDPLFHERELGQLVFEAVSERLVDKYNLTNKEINECLPQIPLTGKITVSLVAKCREQEFSCQCDRKTPYRTADGTCNNLANPTWGSVGSCFQRMLLPGYVGISGRRQSVLGGPLPEPRDLSLNVHKNLDNPTRDISHMFMFFGQLLDHEITQGATSITSENLAMQCCVAGETHPQCIPISVRADDPFYSQFNTACINMPRSVICPTCKLGPRQQTTAVTSFMDGSVFYGTSHAETLTLRTLDGTGRMRVQNTPHGDLLPPSPDPENDQCSFPETNDICFQAGDARANEHPPLASLQTIFVLQHNKIANSFKEMHPHWDGDKIFEESRNIVAAIFQAIVYQEYLPTTLGDKYLKKFDLQVHPNKRTKYEPKTNPSIFNEFTAAAFRFSHSLINTVLASHPLNSTGGQLQLRDQFFQAYNLHKGILSQLMQGTTECPAQSFDQHLVEDVTNFLYRIRGTEAGLDLASVNINRGRDHGLPAYADMARHCSGGKLKVEDFDGVVDDGLISPANRDVLRNNYKSIDDVDLWTGLLSEIPLEGAVVGPTTACIVGAQFRALRYGDRFYFEHKNQGGSFTSKQVEEIKQMTLAKLLCLNTNAHHFRKNVLLLPLEKNPILDCRKVKNINMSLWQ